MQQEKPQEEELRVNPKGQAPDHGEIRTDEDALKLEGVLSKQKGEMYILMFADWCGHCQTYKPFWKKLAALSNRMVEIAAVQDTQMDNVPVLKTAPSKGFPTVIHFKDGVMTPVDSEEMRDKAKMEARVTKNDKHGSLQMLLGNGGGPIGQIVKPIIQVGAGILTRSRRHWRRVFPMKSIRKTRSRPPSRRNERSRKVKRAGRRL